MDVRIKVASIRMVLFALSAVLLLVLVVLGVRNMPFLFCLFGSIIFTFDTVYQNRVRSEFQKLAHDYFRNREDLASREISRHVNVLRLEAGLSVALWLGTVATLVFRRTGKVISFGWYVPGALMAFLGVFLYLAADRILTSVPEGSIWKAAYMRIAFKLSSLVVSAIGLLFIFRGHRIIP